MKIVAFTGYKGSGKDTAAKALVNAETWKFAEPLKAMIRVYLFYRGVPESEIEALIEGELKEVESRYFGYKTCRFAQQTIGTEWARKMIDENIWVDTMEDRIRSYINQKSKTPVRITDVRFLNEENMLKKFHIPIIRITRPGLLVDLSHPSESEMSKIQVDFTITNNGSVNDLISKVHKVIRSL